MDANIRPEDFWNWEYTKQLPPTGKLALNYALGREHANDPVIIEDMALATGLEASECSDWVEMFVQDNQLEESVVAE